MSWSLLLLLLICPIMMLFMMKGHNHGGRTNHGRHDHHNHSTEQTQMQPSEEVERLEGYKVKQLKGEIDLLKNRNESLQHELEKYSQKAYQKR